MQQCSKKPNACSHTFCFRCLSMRSNVWVLRTSDGRGQVDFRLAIRIKRQLEDCSSANVDTAGCHTGNAAFATHILSLTSYSRMKKQLNGGDLFAGCPAETGRIRGFGEYGFKHRAQCACWALTEFWGESSVRFCQPIICVPKRTHRVVRRTPESAAELRNSAPKTVLSKQYSSRFLVLLGIGGSLSGSPQKLWKRQQSGADIHDAKARVSITPGGFNGVSDRKAPADL